MSARHKPSPDIPSSQYEPESQTDKFKQKILDHPEVPIGILGTLGMLSWGAYEYRHRGNMSPSVFFMHLRVKSQGMVVGALGLGVAYGLIKSYVWPKKEE